MNLSRLFVIALIFVGTLVTSSDTVACKCANGSVEEQLDRADRILVGRVEGNRINRRWVEDYQNNDPPPPPLLTLTTIRVLESLKGDVPSMVTVASVGAMGDCSVVMDPGQDVFLALTKSEPGHPAIVTTCTLHQVLYPYTLFKETRRAGPAPGGFLYFLRAVRNYLETGEAIPECARDLGDLFSGLSWELSPLQKRCLALFDEVASSYEKR